MVAAGSWTPVVANIAGHADDLAPCVNRRNTNALSERCRRLAPHLARHVLGNQSDGAFIEDIGPGEISSRDDRRADGAEVARRDEFEAAEWRKLPRLVDLVFGHDRVVGVETFKGQRIRERRRGDTGNCR
jgi:hypothetical protein